QVAAYLDDPRFTRQMVRFWQDVFRTGGSRRLRRAAAFATAVVVDDRPYTDLLTASTGTCVDYELASGELVAGDCENGITAVGVLTDPGVMYRFAGSLAFRRTRWVQETFACAPFPAEVVEAQDVGGASPYTAPWPFERLGS